jgi:hypothetical protein
VRSGDVLQRQQPLVARNISCWHRHNLTVLAYGLGDWQSPAAGAAPDVDPGLEVQPTNDSVRLGSADRVVQQPALSRRERIWVPTPHCHHVQP